jgi:uncharacterized protein
MSTIERAEQLRAMYPDPSARAVGKQLDHLDRHCRRFIELSPFLVLATSDRGCADASPRGGPPGFVWVPDPHTLVIPDWPGNNRIDSLQNIVANPGVGLLFLIPGIDETLRVNGNATVRDDDLRGHFTTGGRLPRTVIRVEVREAFLHCAKALMRSQLWAPDARTERPALPTMGEMLKEQCQLPGPPESQDAMLARYRGQLY